MSNNFNLQKYLIENKLTTNSKLLREIRIEPDWNVGRRDSVIEIEMLDEMIESIKEYVLDTDFVTHCQEKGDQILEKEKEDYGEGWEDYIVEHSIGKPFFNADMTACSIAAGEKAILRYTYILSSSLQADVRAKLLDEEITEDEIDAIEFSLGIQHN